MNALNLSNLRILVLEAEPLILLDTKYLLERGGAGKVDVARSIAEAERFMFLNGRPDAFVLNLESAGHGAEAFAATLVGRGIGVVLTSSILTQKMLGGDLKGMPLLSKPYVQVQLIDAILSLLRAKPTAALDSPL